MSILSTSSNLIKVGQDYRAGSGISIDDHVISVTGEFGKTYSAGDNISIYEQGEQLYISPRPGMFDFCLKPQPHKDSHQSKHLLFWQKCV